MTRQKFIATVLELNSKVIEAIREQIKKDGEKNGK